MKGQRLGNTTSFKYLGAVVSDKRSKTEGFIKGCTHQCRSDKLKPIWRDNNARYKIECWEVQSNDKQRQWPIKGGQG